MEYYTRVCPLLERNYAPEP